MNGGEFTRTFLYPIKAFVAENVGKDYIRIQHKTTSSSWNSSWSGMLRNLKSGNAWHIFNFRGIIKNSKSIVLSLQFLVDRTVPVSFSLTVGPNRFSDTMNATGRG